MAIGSPILYLVADRTFSGTDRVWLQDIERATAALASLEAPGLIVLFQLRAKNVGVDVRADLVARGLDIARSAGAPVLLNGTENEARELGFSGVHWPEAMIPNSDPTSTVPAQQRNNDHSEPAGDGFLRIAAVHSVPAAQLATEAGADAVVFGPVFTPGSKPGDGVGLAALATVASRSAVPVIAIGGIDAVEARECLLVGAAGVAVVSAVFSRNVDVSRRIGELRSAMRC